MFNFERSKGKKEISRANYATSAAEEAQPVSFNRAALLQKSKLFQCSAANQRRQKYI